jgi:thioredoxin-dependent peroxiredoxin
MLTKNQIAPEIVANSIGDQQIDLYKLRGKKVLIKFHRFSGCPVCQHQIHTFIKEYNALAAAGIETIVFMHSSKKKILSNFNEVPGLHIIADRQKTFYHLFYSEFLWRKVFSMASWISIFTAFFNGYFPQFNKFEGGVIGVPSDFLVDEKSMISNLHYGKHFGDSWSVSDVLGRITNS